MPPQPFDKLFTKYKGAVYRKGRALSLHAGCTCKILIKIETNRARAIHSLEGKMYSQLPDPILSAVGGASLACTMSAKVQWPEAEVRC